MELTIKREVLLAALGPVAAAVPVRTTRPILQMIRFDAVPAEDVAETSHLHLAATNQEISVARTIAGPPDVLHVGKRCGGRLLYEPGRLLRILRELDDDKVVLRADPKGAAVVGKGATFVLPTVDETEAEKFPEVTPWSTPDFHVELEACALRQMLKRTLFAVPKKETHQRYAIGGVLWELDGDKLNLIATDTKRLSVVDAKVERFGEEPAADGKPPSLIVPRDTLDLLVGSLDDGLQIVRATVGKDEAVFQVGSLTIRSQMVAGRFPPWRDIMPKKPLPRFQMNVGPVVQAMKTSRSLVNAETKRVELDFAMGGLTIRVGDKQDGDGEIFVEHSDWGTKASAAFNPDYLLDVLKSVGEDQIEAQVGGEGKPSIFRSGESFQHMIMALS
jgi:DNA polymerase-3 subunit beta